MQRSPSKRKGPVLIAGVVSDLTEALRKHSSRQGKIASLWERAVGKEKARHSSISTLENGTLTVTVESASFLYEFSLEKETLLKRLRKKFAEEIKDLRFQVGDLTR